MRVEAPWGEPLDPAAVLGAEDNPKVIAVVHAETSTGVRNDVEPLGRGKGEALLLVDAVTSLGGLRLQSDDWDLDIVYSGTQKCLGVPPGLAPITVSDRARRHFVERPSSWYLDLGLIAQYVEGDGGRKYHHTAPVSMIYALAAGLEVLLEEGMAEVIERHRACGELLQSGLEHMGLELVAPKEHRLPQLTTVYVPDDLPGGRDRG